MPEPSLTRPQAANVGLFLAGRLLWLAASQIFNVAVGWLVYDQTRSAWALGLVGLVTFLPRIPLTLLAGVLADRYDRRRVIAAALTANAIAAFAAMWGILSGAPGAGWIYACVLLYGIGRAFAGPAAQSLIANLIPRDSYARVMGLSSSVGHLRKAFRRADAGNRRAARIGTQSPITASGIDGRATGKSGLGPLEALWKHEAEKRCAILTDRAKPGRYAGIGKCRKLRNNSRFRVIVHGSFDTTHNLKAAGRCCWTLRSRTSALPGRLSSRRLA